MTARIATSRIGWSITRTSANTVTCRMEMRSTVPLFNALA